MGWVVTKTLASREFVQGPTLPLKVKVTLPVGVTIILEAFDPVFQLYVLAPEAIKVALDPEQILGVFTLRFGLGLTEIDSVLVPIHPLVLLFKV